MLRSVSSWVGSRGLASLFEGPFESVRAGVGAEQPLPTVFPSTEGIQKRFLASSVVVHGKRLLEFLSSRE
jgi:hypothetical protein